MFTEDDLLPLSGLQHLRYCERQWALIHIERQWEENRLTAEGRLLHERVHDAGAEARPGLLVARGLQLRSLRFGLSGQADAVEFHAAPGLSDRTIALPGRCGYWRPFPVEYKRGRPKADSCDEIQLCAQALCLEEALAVKIEAGALFYGKTRRRIDVAFDEQLRQLTAELARRMHELYSAAATPPAVYSKRKCGRCSLFDRCLPRTTSPRRPVAAWFRRTLESPE